MSDQFDLPSTDRRSLMAGAAAAAAGAFLAPGLAVAASADLAVIRKAAEADKADAIKRLQEWIALPTVAATAPKPPTPPSRWGCACAVCARRAG